MTQSRNPGSPVAGSDGWAQRSPIVEAIDRDGDFLDVGCANGLLLEDIVRWAASAGHAIVPHGIDLGTVLIELARRRLPGFAANLVVADASSWEPKRTWDHVFSMADLAGLAGLLERCGYQVTGKTVAGEPPISRFAWTAP